MKKLVSAVLVLSMLVVMFATLSAVAEGKAVEIVVWTKDRHDQEFMTGKVDAFNKAHEGKIRIDYQIYSDNYPQTIDMAASTNELPDILVTTTNNINVIYQDKLADLSPFLTEEEKAFFGESAFVENWNRFGSKIVSLPATGTTTRLVYNKDIFDRVGIANPPSTLAELVADAKLISEKLSGEGIYGFALPLKNPSNGLTRGVQWAPSLSGAPVKLGFDYTQGKYDFSCYKPVIEAMREIFTSNAAFPGCEQLEIDPLRTQFADGKIGMYMTYNHSEWGVYTKQFPTAVNWQYAPLPSVDGNVIGSQDLSAGTWFAISERCPNKEAAWEVLKMFYSKELISEYYSQGLGVVVVEAAIDGVTPPESIEKVPYIAVQPTDKIWPPEPKGIVPEGNDWGKDFGDIIFGLRDDVDAVIEDLNVRYNAAYDKAIADGTQVRIQYPNFHPADPAGTAVE